MKFDARDNLIGDTNKESMKWANNLAKENVARYNWRKMKPNDKLKFGLMFM